MSDYRQPNRDSLVPSGNRTLPVASSPLIKRGLELATRIPMRALDAENTNFSDPDWGAYATAKASGNYEEMFKFAKILANRYPDCAFAHVGLAYACINLRFIDEAIASCLKATKLRANDSTAWLCLGYAYSEAGQNEDAVAALRQVEALNSDDAHVWHSLGSGYRELGRHTEAASAFQRAHELNPDLLD